MQLINKNIFCYYCNISHLNAFRLSSYLFTVTYCRQSEVLTFLYNLSIRNFQLGEKYLDDYN